MSKLRVRGIELGYEDKGTGPAVVLLHGYPFNRSLWDPQIKALTNSHRVIAPDLRGHGESDIAPASIDEMARDVEALMTALEVPNAILGGLSMGGYVALSFTRLFPLRVQGLVLADTRASSDTEEIRQTRKRQSEVILRDGMQAIADDMLSRLFAPGTKISHPEVIETVRRMILGTQPEGAAAALKAMAERDDKTAFLPLIESPTLIICGRHDGITPPKDSELMHREIKESRLVMIEDAGHVSNLEQPEPFNRALIEFLQSV